MGVWVRPLEIGPFSPGIGRRRKKRKEEKRKEGGNVKKEEEEDRRQQVKEVRKEEGFTSSNCSSFGVLSRGRRHVIY